MPNSDSQVPAFIYECDRYGGEMRIPAEVEPWDPNTIIASNHFLVSCQM